MKGSDKYLIGIVAGIALLVIVALAVVLSRPEPEYRDDDSPDAVVHNYLLALRTDDFQRAYECLSPTLAGYPDNLEIFIENVEDRSYKFRLDNEVALNVESAKIRADTATVEVLETRAFDGGPMDSGQVNRGFDMKLRQDNGAWKLVDGDSYWYSCWDDPKEYCW
jgi:hypothetical protein